MNLHRLRHNGPGEQANVDKGDTATIIETLAEAGEQVVETAEAVNN